jgi:hypothetical protein
MAAGGSTRLWRAAGWLALAHIATMLGGFAVEKVAPLGAKPSAVASAYVTWPTGKALVGSYVAGTGFLLFLLVATLLGRLLRGEGDTSAWLSSVVAASGCVYVAITLATAFALSSAALYAGHHGATLATVSALGDAHWFAVFFATAVLGLFTLTVAAAVYATGALPRWVSYGGFAAGVACLVGAIPGAREAFVDDATLVWMVWYVGLAVAALRRPRGAMSSALSMRATTA